MHRRTLKLINVVFVITFGVITCLNPIFPRDQLLQHIGTVALLSIAVLDIKSDRLKLSTFLCVSLFIMIHIIGARYVYSYVPYNEWIKSLFHFDMNGFFHLTRNHYDRFVHFSFGILFFPYLNEIMVRRDVKPLFFRMLFVWMVIQTGSMLYELFEWILTYMLSGDAADNYNGQQGDMWDAQKDMALALLGSSLMLIAYLIRGVRDFR